jgi:hypothetical protein
MAEIRKIIPNDPISNFRNVAPTGGTMFGVLADLANVAYERLAPVAAEKMAAKGAEQGREMARQAMGQGRTIGLSAGLDGVSQGAQSALEALQASWGSPLKINSAYRDKDKNAAVGGAKNSQHIHGNAFDVDTTGMDQSQRDKLIRQARASGFSGIGVYDNSLHFDVGGDRAWGPSYHRDSLPPEFEAAVSSPLGAPPTSDKGGVVVRTSDNKIEPRLYSPLSGPILQAHNAAAAIAYNAEIMNQAAVDLFEISNTFPMDPDGFKTAAEGYIDETVNRAPDQFRPALRETLTKQTQQRFLGIVEDRHTDIRQRAANSSAALMDRHTNDLAEAIASGNEEAVTAASAQLDDVLKAREALPGLSWTPEQSQNQRIRATELAARTAQTRRTEVEKEVKGQLGTVVSAAKDGLTSAYDNILNDPDVRAMFPDEWSKAAGWRAFADGLPSFNSLTPDQMDEAVSNLASMPITETWQGDMVGAAKTAAKDARAAWDKDPQEAAKKYMVQSPPPPLKLDPEGFVQSFSERIAFTDRTIIGKGYTDNAAYVSKAEAKTLAAVFDPSMAPEARAAAAIAIVTAASNAGNPAAAAKILKDLGSGDPVTMFGGMLAASGGDPTLLATALTGEALMKDKQVKAPKDADQMATFSPEAFTALKSASGEDEAGNVMKFATALYAADPMAATLEPDSEEAKTLLAAKVNIALGRTEFGNHTYGGVADLGGHQVLLPPSVDVEAAQGALERAMTLGMTPVGDDGDVEAYGYLAYLGGIMTGAWTAAGGEVPLVRGEPITPRDYQRGNIRLVPSPSDTDRNRYRMEWVSGDTVLPIHNSAGTVYFFDLDKLIDATPRRKWSTPVLNTPPEAATEGTDPTMVAP